MGPFPGINFRKFKVFPEFTRKDRVMSWEKYGLTEKQFSQLQKEAKAELCRRDFWEFCKALGPDFYKEDRAYLKRMCYEIDDFLKSDDRLMVINVPPRHGKSRTMQNLTKYVFGLDPHAKIMTGSYNEDLSTTFSRAVRNEIGERKADKDRIVYHDIFPNTRIKKGSAAAGMWMLDGSSVVSYLATSPKGTATGFGATLMVIDDVIKSDEEANNETYLQKLWDWFTKTMLSRREKGSKIIIVATRWHSKDLSGRAIEHFKAIQEPFRCIVMKAKQDDGTMLCDEVLSLEDYEFLCRTVGAEIVAANYDQQPIDLVGRLYNVGFKTYVNLPCDRHMKSVIEEVCAYCDTADRGSDYLCLIIYARYQSSCYVLDVYFTKDGMEITEGETAKRLHEFKVNRAFIESNNGGRGFGRSVERILREKYHWYDTYIDLFTQSRNKRSRIITSATWCQENIYFPVGWEAKWNEFCNDVLSYQKEGKMAHDDAEDTLAGIYDRVGRRNIFDFSD